MPKVTYNVAKKPQDKKIKVDSLTCAMCAKTQKPPMHFQSYNPIYATGYLPYCKQCLKNMCMNQDKTINLEKMKEMLKLIDRPFLYDIVKISFEDKGDTIGTYIKNIAMTQYKDLGWKDSIFEPQLNSNNNTNMQNSSVHLENFIVTDDLIEKWNAGYSKEEYYYFEKKWQKLIDNYGEKTSFHVEALTTYIRFRVREELATAKGDIKEAKEWATMAKDAATAAKINVSQLSKSDISGGVELLPQLFEAVESQVGIISILPKLKEQPMDDADLIIWCIVNYNRRLEDKPRVEYREIWNFYDEMLNEYFKTQGYTKKQIKAEKEKRNSVFRDLGEVYKEPVYEEGD